MTEKESKVTEEIVEYLRKDMPDMYKEFFRALKKYRGNLNEVLFHKELEYLHNGEIPPAEVLESVGMNRPIIPHPVHFREGKAVRNSLRKCEHCKDWSDHDFDDNWAEAVEKAIEEKGGEDL